MRCKLELVNFRPLFPKLIVADFVNASSKFRLIYVNAGYLIMIGSPYKLCPSGHRIVAVMALWRLLRIATNAASGHSWQWRPFVVYDPVPVYMSN